ncbi:MAG: hypothetical protein Q9209_001684 [Squamulea sp. 1 TL-2023]
MHPPPRVPTELSPNETPDDRWTVGYESAQEEASRHQMLWTNVMAEGKYQNDPFYEQVEVLLLCWAVCDMDTEGEVEDLKSVFINDFGYGATKAYLDARSKTKLQVQVNARVAKFVEDYDGSGIVLVENRLFEYLAAAQGQSTTGVPGPTSFTRALIFALKALVREKKEGRFTTDELLRKIKNDAPDFPKDIQTPVLTNRDSSKKDSAGRIMLHPIQQDKTVKKVNSEDCLIREATGYVMTLHFQFGGKPPDDDIVKLGKELNEIFKHNTLEVHRVRWGGMEATPFTHVTGRLQKSLWKRRASSLSQRPTNLADTTPSSTSLIGSLDTSLLSPYAVVSAAQDFAGDESCSPFTASSPVTPPESDMKTSLRMKSSLLELAQEGAWEETIDAKSNEEEHSDGNPVEKM